MIGEELPIQVKMQISAINHYDVIVVGGGCAGFSAAVASGRNGASTLLIEQFPFLGGTATASLMGNMVGFRNQSLPNNRQVCRGIAEELMLGLLAEGGAEQTRNAYHTEGGPFSDVSGDLSYSYAVDTEKLKYLTLKMAVEAGVRILFHTYFIEPIVENAKVIGIIYAGKTGLEAAYGKTIIDATGDADVAVRAGVTCYRAIDDGSKHLHNCLMFKVRGFDETSIDLRCCVHNGEMIVWGPTCEEGDATDTEQLAQMEIDTRLRVYEYFDKLRKKHPCLAKAYIADTGCLLGIRQTRFIKGVYTLTQDDVLCGRIFDDTITLAINPVMEYFGYRKYLKHEGYGIPYRCLLPEKVNGILVAGRCISADQCAFESYRAMAHILNIGEAAGTAAALSAQTGMELRDLDIHCLQKQLKNQGMELGF